MTTDEPYSRFIFPISAVRLTHTRAFFIFSSSRTFSRWPPHERSRCRHRGRINGQPDHSNGPHGSTGRETPATAAPPDAYRSYTVYRSVGEPRGEEGRRKRTSGEFCYYLLVLLLLLFRSHCSTRGGGHATIVLVPDADVMSSSEITL